MTNRWNGNDLAQFAARGRVAQSEVNRLLARAPVLRSSRRGAMNKLEAAFAQRLEFERLAGSWQWWAFEGITLRLANDTRYTPDFAALDAGGHLVMHETKGFWRDDAKVKIKVAAELYPFFRFVAWTRAPKRLGGNWASIQY